MDSPIEDDATEKQASKPLFYKKELLGMTGLGLVLSLVFASLILLYKGPESLKVLFYNANGSFTIDTNLLPFLIGFSLIDTLIMLVSYFFLPLCGQEKPEFKSLKNWVIFFILFLLGLAAYFIIALGLRTLNCPLFICFLLANLIYSLYIWLMAKLYFYGYIQDKRLFFEIVRFAIVGATAAVFDLSVCSLFQFIILPASWPAIAITIISVTMGFIIGVVVNYLCSVYMVFKSTTSKDISKTTKGRLLFLGLSAVGLFIGYGLQYLFYDVLSLGYILVFIIRTIVVLFWNYLSRKYIIFR